MLRLAVAASVLVVAAGCSDPQPKEPEPEPSSSVTPTVAAPTMPAQAKENSPEGAAAFAEHFITRLSAAISTSSVGMIEQLHTPSCKACRKYSRMIRADRVAERELDGFGWTITSVGVTENVVRLSFDSRGYRTRSTARDQWTVVEAGKHKVGLQVEYANGMWIVDEMLMGDSV